MVVGGCMVVKFLFVGFVGRMVTSDNRDPSFPSADVTIRPTLLINRITELLVVLSVLEGVIRDKYFVYCRFWIFVGDKYLEIARMLFGWYAKTI
jgi:hypothetical protein